MADITLQQAAATGAALTLSAAASGDKAANSRGRTMFLARNADGSPHTLTIPAAQTTRPADGNFPAMTVPDIVVAIAGGATALVGPIPQAYNGSDGKFTTNWNSTTSVTVAAFEVP